MKAIVLLPLLALATLGCHKPPPLIAVDAGAASVTTTESAPLTKLIASDVEVRPAKPATIGGHEVKAEVCKLDASAPELSGNQYSNAVSGAVMTDDGALFVLTTDQLRKYRPSATNATCELALDSTFGDHGLLSVPNARTLSGGGHGAIYTNDSQLRAVRVEGSAPVLACSSAQVGAVDAAGKRLYAKGGWRDLTAINCPFEDWKSSTWSRERYDSPRILPYGDSDIVVSDGLHGSGSAFRIGLFAQDGKRRALVGTADGDEHVCMVGPVTKGTHGILVVDSNCRALKAWSENGTFQGTTSLFALTGVGDLWPVALSQRDGIGYLAMAVAPRTGRSDGRKSIGAIARVTGL